MKKLFIYLSILCLISTANAGIIVNIQQVGQNIVASYSGSIASDDNMIIAPETSPPVNGMISNEGKLDLGNTSSEVTQYIQLDDVSPRNFGTGSSVNANIFEGQPFGFSLVDNLFYLPRNYTLGTPLQGSATWNSKSFADLGLTPGSHTVSWANNDSIIINIIPEPSAFILLAIGGIALLAKRKRRS